MKKKPSSPRDPASVSAREESGQTANRLDRIEKDSMGEMLVPANALWGASTQRAVQNFPIGSLRPQPTLISALALIKAAAAQANLQLQDLDAIRAKAIIAAAKQVADGTYDEHFVVGLFQTGSGTSTNMNANEVIAALTKRSLSRSSSKKNKSAVAQTAATVHPNDHVNMGQSSNDVIPTAIHVAVAVEIAARLIPALQTLQDGLTEKATQYSAAIKTGRTHLQDATPVTFGQEFEAYASQISACINRLKVLVEGLCFVALGGTAVGTGINTRETFAALALRNLSRLVNSRHKTKLRFREAPNHLAAQGSIDSLVDAAGVLQTLSTALIKIANDIRWMASGPRAGLNEILLPAIQPGSSIMPGKVNPVICEAIMQVGYRTLGNCQTVVYATQSSNFELNVALPVVSYSLLESLQLLSDAVVVFQEKCLDGLAPTRTGAALVERGLALCTALAPVVGYDLAASIAKEADSTGETILAVALRRTQIERSQLEKILDPMTMTRPGLSGVKLAQ
ncbi:MAG: class II fumarate hydratase [Candidatus Obscuribacterales bacterium]|nr:class II fumarate hydratase [Candidatus Obscuribacterales bacterium]